jgi:hypothetical protein
MLQFICFAAYSAGRVLGLESFLARQTARLSCLLLGRNSFAATERLLTECCGCTVSDERIRQVCQAESTRIGDLQRPPGSLLGST